MSHCLSLRLFVGGSEAAVAWWVVEVGSLVHDTGESRKNTFLLLRWDARESEKTTTQSWNGWEHMAPESPTLANNLGLFCKVDCKESWKLSWGVSHWYLRVLLRIAQSGNDVKTFGINLLVEEYIGTSWYLESVKLVNLIGVKWLSLAVDIGCWKWRRMWSQGINFMFRR